MDADISLIIVNYNTGRLLSDCLDSIYDSLTMNYEVIVVDNASSDDSFSQCREKYAGDRRFVFRALGYNSGFAKANNIGVSLSKGRILHFLNPDTRIAPSLQKDYEAVLKSPNALYVNPLVNKDGSLENDRMPIPCLRDIFYWNIRSPKARFWYKGASVILSASDFRAIGGWSEDYFLYSEDLDLFYKAWLNNLPIRMLESEIFHLGKGSSSAKWTELEREIVVQKSMRIFFEKYFSRFEYVAVKLYYLVHFLFKRPSAVPFYLKAWRLSGN